MFLTTLVFSTAKAVGNAPLFLSKPGALMWLGLRAGSTSFHQTRVCKSSLSFMAFSVLYVAGVAYWLARERAARRRAEKLERQESGSTTHEIGESEKQ